ncbi:MAG: hypothetical protein WCT05_16005 [Lentisphaeria bacterium]
MFRILFILLFAGACLLPAAEPDLIPNSGFEKSQKGVPVGWSTVDGLTVSYGKDGNPGHCVIFDTAVLQKDKKAYKEDPTSYQGPGKGGQYSTVGAHEGVWVFSQPIDLRKDDECFVITADVKADVIAAPMVLIRGFALVTTEQAGKNNSIFQIPHAGGPAYSEQFGPESNRRDSQAGDYLQVWRHTLVCRITKVNEWQHFEMGFPLPKEKRFRPQRIWLKPYAYWPLGNYQFDNVTLRRSTREEVAEINRRRPSILKRKK